jgi:Zn-dependent peptidase ImmA (M78 family)
MLIDNTVLEDWKEYRLRSTIGHECGHWVFHSDFYAYAKSRNNQKKIVASGIVGCKKTDIEGGLEIIGKKRLVTDIDRLEHHAKYFSAAILMPKTPFINAVTDLTATPYFNELDLAEKLSGIFQVSPISASIRLSQLGFTQYAGKNPNNQKDSLTYSGRCQALCE